MKNMVDFGPAPDLSGAKQRLTIQVPRVKILLELEEDLEYVAMLGCSSKHLGFMQFVFIFAGARALCLDLHTICQCYKR